MILFISNFILLGMQGPSGSSTGPPPPDPGYVVMGTQLPIDKNIWILIAAGIIFGVYIVYRRSQSTNKAS